MIPLLGAIPVIAQSTDAPSAPSISQSGKKGGLHREKALSNLNDAERKQLKSAMHRIKGDPRLVAARQAVTDAQTKEAKTEAKKAAHQLRRELLLQADPSIAPILEKIQPGKSVE